MVTVFNRRHIQGCALLVLGLILSAPLPCSSSHSSLRNEDHGSKHRHESTLVREEEPIALESSRENQQRQRQRQMQQRMVQEGELSPQGEYCGLCQGLEILPDKISDPVGAPGMTCTEIDLYYRYSWPPPSNVTVNHVGSCRADDGYKFHSESCCKASVPKYECEQNIHEFVLGGGNGLPPYNSAVPPIKDIDDPLVVSVNIVYQALEHIEVEEGTATIFVTVILRWIDPRLTWDVVDNTTCSNIIDVFTGNEVEKTMIWVPDFDLLNQIDGIQTARETKAVVHSDGTVEWSRTAGLKAFCSLRGLASIPFDTLGCQLLFGTGSRVYSGQVQYVLNLPDLIGVGAFELAYNEWTLDKLRLEQGTTFRNTIYYNFYLERATQYYMQNIVLPTIMLTYLSFFTFLLDLRVGERLGFAMALALVVVAQQIVTVGLSPVSNQRMFMDKFVAWSFYWVLFGVVQSVIIGFLQYAREDRQAKKENQRLSMLSVKESKSMMMQLEEIKKAEEAAEERMGLAEHPEEGLQEDVPKTPPAKDSWIYTFSLRKFDMVSLVFALVTYTAFVVTMFLTVSAGTWLTNEPRWFDESDAIYPTEFYSAKDPNA